MKLILKTLTISTVIVFGYSIFLILVVGPLAYLGMFGRHGAQVLSALSLPFELPGSIYRYFWPLGPNSGRGPLLSQILLLVGILGTNIFLYYMPIRLVLEWQDQKKRLP